MNRNEYIGSSLCQQSNKTKNHYLDRAKHKHSPFNTKKQASQTTSLTDATFEQTHFNALVIHLVASAPTLRHSYYSQLFFASLNFFRIA